MRERRWESRERLTFADVLAVGERLAARGLAPAHPAKDVICYIEDWTVRASDDFDRLDPWHTEDITLVQTLDAWRGDFFLLAGGYHTVYLRHQAIGTYCSVSHPWAVPPPLTCHEPRGMLWLGFRHIHTFIRVRLQTTEVITPGETRGDDRRALWTAERAGIFQAVIRLLDLAVHVDIVGEQVVLTPKQPGTPLFCSWPDAFGPCQFEYNTSDPYEFLVPASRLAATWGDAPAAVRAYLTGFAESALEEFRALHPQGRTAYRCSAHTPLDELPEILEAIAPDGRLYATVCEFQTPQLLPAGDEASAIVGAVGADGGFRLEMRLNRAPLPEPAMAPWLSELLGHPMVYAPLPAFP
jgi:hypothetical protein